MKNSLTFKFPLQRWGGRSKFLFGIFFSMLLLASCSSLPRKNAPDHINELLASSPAFQQGFTGLVVYDPVAEKLLFDHNGEKYFTPASNMKLFTFYTGLVVLKDSVPALKYIVSNDSLIFWGTGDPSLLHEQLPDSKVYPFLTDRKENLYYAAPNFAEELLGPGWAWDDYNSSYSVERGDLPVYGNSVSITFPEDGSTPKAEPAFFQDSLHPGTRLAGNRSQARRQHSSNSFLYDHAPGNKARVQVIPFRYSPELVASLLSDTLQRPVKLLQPVPEDLKPQKLLYSIPTDSLYKRMLQESDNFIAEQLLLMAAGKLSDTLRTEIAIDHMLADHLQDLPDVPRWVDGSGLSRYNLVTPRSMVKLLEKISAEIPQERLFRLLPAGGSSGTLKNSFKAEEPYIFAKTGSLRNNYSLSGYLKTTAGRLLIFSFMNSNYVVPSSEIKAEMEKIMLLLRDNF